MAELAKWLGRPSLKFALDKIPEKEMKDISKALDENPPAGMKPPRQLRKPLPVPAYEYDDARNLVFDFVEPVDLLAALKKTEYAAKIKSEKWADKVSCPLSNSNPNSSCPIPPIPTSGLARTREPAHTSLLHLSDSARYVLTHRGAPLAGGSDGHGHSVRWEPAPYFTWGLLVADGRLSSGRFQTMPSALL